MIKIRELNGNEFGRLAEIFNSARTHAGCFSGEPVDLGGIKALTEGEVIYVAKLRNQIVGFASVWVPDSFIHHLYVHPDFHRQGIGSELLNFCGIGHGPLSVKCEISNLTAQHFYRNRGWVARGLGEGIDGVWERLYSPTPITSNSKQTPPALFNRSLAIRINIKQSE